MHDDKIKQNWNPNWEFLVVIAYRLSYFNYQQKYNSKLDKLKA